MTIYQYRTILTSVAGSGGVTSLNVRGGILRHVIIKANTATTLFKSNLVDDNGVNLMNWNFHRDEINDSGIAIPVAGKYTLNVTSASPNDTFSVYMGVEE